MKFLCDQMLVRLGRWLRAAGYDIAIVENALDDREIVDMALMPAGDESIEKVPKGTRERFEDYRECRHCQKVYWLGTHAERMLGQLTLWSGVQQT